MTQDAGVLTHALRFLRAGSKARVPRADEKIVPRHLCPSGHKLYDFREEPGFGPIAAQIRAEGRTYLQANRLLTLWHAARNTRSLSGTVAEVGTYRGGSARFLGASLEHFGESPELLVFDTFEGHPDIIDESVDGWHTAHSNFADTSYEEVRAYLADYSNISVLKGDFASTCAQFADRAFKLCHVDVDIYQSTVDCLSFFWPRLAAGGVIVIDDYGFNSCVGAKKATDEFLAETEGAQGWYVHTGQFVLTRLA